MKNQVFNPYLPSWEYVPDGEPYVFDNRVFVYGSHDHFNHMAYCANDYVCWSAPVDDLSDWRCDGVMYRKEQEPFSGDGQKQLWAPDVQRGKDGRYYLYYSALFEGWIGVAVSELPQGPYEFYGHIQYKDGTTAGINQDDVFLFDPAVLLDDDGRVFLYSGFAPAKEFPLPEGLKHEGGYVLELEPDMITIKKGPELIIPMSGKSVGTGFTGHEFYEASSIRKINDTYYLVYSSIQGHELCYAVSNYPDKNFCYGGTIISNGDIGYQGRREEDRLNYTANNHGGLVNIRGQWYIFYHRHTNFQQTSRQGCAEKVVIRQDGIIPQVEITSCGLNGGVLEGKGTYEARIACNLKAKEGAIEYPYYSEPADRMGHPYITQNGGDRERNGDQYIANMRDGSMAGFKYFDLSGTTHISVKVRGNAEGKIIVTSGDDGNTIAEIQVKESSIYCDYEAEIKPSQSKSALYFTFKGRGSLDFYSFTLN